MGEQHIPVITVHHNNGVVGHVQLIQGIEHPTHLHAHAQRCQTCRTGDTSAFAATDIARVTWWRDGLL